MEAIMPMPATTNVNSPTFNEIYHRRIHVKWLSDETTTPPAANYAEERCDNNVQARLVEESAKKALLLKKKELKWKLMQVSQAKNQEKLKEIQTAVNYHRRKLSKAQELAARLRGKYIKVVKSAKLTELQHKKAEDQLSQQERFVADEKMQLTKLAFDCLNTGAELYGDAYKLPENSKSKGGGGGGGGCSSDSRQQRADAPHRATGEKLKCVNLIEGEHSGESQQRSTTSDPSLLDKLSPFLRNARLNAGATLQNPAGVADQSVTSNAIAPVHSQPLAIDRQGPPLKRLKRHRTTSPSPIHGLNDGFLKNLASYRLTNLLGECSDRLCRYQHKSNYHMTDLERLTDLLSYRPSVAGYKPDPDLSLAENLKMCRIKLKKFAAKLISRNADKSIETIARNLIRKIRADQPDIELILKRRELPKTAHLKAPPPTCCPCTPIFSSEAAPDLVGPAAVTIKLEPIDFE